MSKLIVSCTYFNVNDQNIGTCRMSVSLSSVENERVERKIRKNIILLVVSKQGKFLFGTQYIYKYKPGLNITKLSKGVDLL